MSAAHKLKLTEADDKKYLTYVNGLKEKLEPE